MNRKKKQPEHEKEDENHHDQDRHEHGKRRENHGQPVVLFQRKLFAFLCEPFLRFFSR